MGGFAHSKSHHAARLRACSHHGTGLGPTPPRREVGWEQTYAYGSGQNVWLGSRRTCKPHRRRLICPYRFGKETYWPTESRQRM